MNSVETVLGPIVAENLGFILPHEHLLVDTYDVRRNSDGVLLELSTMCEEVADYSRRW